MCLSNYLMNNDDFKKNIQQFLMSKPSDKKLILIVYNCFVHYCFYLIIKTGNYPV